MGNHNKSPRIGKKCPVEGVIHTSLEVKNLIDGIYEKMIKDEYPSFLISGVWNERFSKKLKKIDEPLRGKSLSFPLSEVSFEKQMPILKGRRGEWLMSEETRDKINCYSYVWFKTTKKDTIDIYGYRFDVKIIEFKYINFKNYIK